MKYYETIKRIFSTQGGIARTRDITDKGIHNVYITKLRERGSISRIKRGMYEWVEEAPPDDLHILFEAVPDAVLCMHSALFYYGYTDRAPGVWHIAVNKDSNKRKVKLDYPPLKVYYTEPHLVGAGISEGVFNGVRVRVYDRDRTICDVLRYETKIDREVFNKAVQAFLKDGKKNMNKLMEYARMFGVHRRAYDAVRVWV